MAASKAKCFRLPYVKALPDGAIRIARPCKDILEEYKPKKHIPDFLAGVDHSIGALPEKTKENKKARKKAKKKLMKEIRQEQAHFHANHLKMKERGLWFLMHLEGRDAAGKGGIVDAFKEAMWGDYSVFQGIPFSKPTAEELAHPYLWRMHKPGNMPAYGMVRVFDRGWQERLLVERVDNITPEYLIHKSYTEIRHYEWGLQRHGGILVKVWLDVSYDEQERRFQKRSEFKPQKKTDADDRARANWDEYTDAANEMFYRTATETAPNFIVPSDNKLLAARNCLRIANMVSDEVIAQQDKELERHAKKAAKKAKAQAEKAESEKKS